MSLEIEMQGERTVAKNESSALRCGYFVISLKYKIKIIELSSSEVTRLETMRQQLILHMTNPELEISTSVSSLLLRIQRVELDFIFRNKLQLWHIFALPFDY